jgi:hypothetical protein
MKPITLKSWTYQAQMNSDPEESLRAFVTYGRRKPAGEKE